jgi:hypothetical protein
MNIMKEKIISALILSAACLPLASAQAQIDKTTGINPPEALQHEAMADKVGNEVGFTSLFNGKDLTGWEGAPDLWSVQDGVITGQTTTEHPAKENTFLIWTNGVVGDFELSCEFKLTPGDSAGFANSGVQFRSKVVKPSYWVVAGYQADMEAGPNYTGNLYEEKGRGTVDSRGQKVILQPGGKIKVVGMIGNPAEIEASIKKDGWNKYVIIAKGNHIIEILNGHKTVDLTDEDEAHAAKSGVLALQIHAGHPMMAQFKDIRIKMLP